MHIPPLAYAAGISVVFPVAAGAAKFRSLDKSLKSLLTLQIIYSSICLIQLFQALNDINNLWTSHVYIIIEYSFLLWIISSWQRSPKVKNILLASIAVFALFWICASMFLEHFDEPASYTNSLSRLVYCAVALYTLRHLALESAISLLKEPRFWIVSALLVSSSGDLMFYSLRGVMAGLSMEDLKLAFSIHWILAIISNLLYSQGYLCRSPRNSGGLLPSAL